MRIVIVKKARKELEKIPSKSREKIEFKIKELKENPTNPQTKKLTNQPGYRLRAGGYRILYLIDLENDKIIIGRIKHRKDAYRNL